MQKSKTLSTFLYCRDGELLKITERIIASIKENPQFPNPTPSVETVEKALQEYSTALSNAGNRDRELVAIKNNKRADLREVLTELSFYITQTCKGDRALIMGSGFDINSERLKPQKALSKMQVDLDVPGQVTARIGRVAGAKAYIFQYTPDPLTSESLWKGDTSLQTIHTFAGFASATKLWLRVIVIDKDGRSSYWDPIMRIVH